MRNQCREGALFNLDNPLFIFQFLQWFMIPVSVLGVFWTWFGMRIEDLDVEEGTGESWLPQSICFNVESSLIIFGYWVACKALTLKRKKFRLYLYIMANLINNSPKQSRISLCLRWVYPPFGQWRECAIVHFSPHAQCSGVLSRSQWYLKHSPSRNYDLFTLNPYFLVGRAFNQLNEPFSEANVTMNFRPYHSVLGFCAQLTTSSSVVLSVSLICLIEIRLLNGLRRNRKLDMSSCSHSVADLDVVYSSLHVWGAEPTISALFHRDWVCQWSSDGCN